MEGLGESIEGEVDMPNDDGLIPSSVRTLLRGSTTFL